MALNVAQAVSVPYPAGGPDRCNIGGDVISEGEKVVFGMDHLAVQSHYRCAMNAGCWVQE